MAITPEQCKGMQILAGFEYEQVEKFIAGCSSEEFAAGKVPNKAYPYATES